jgi:hypothetical protein
MLIENTTMSDCDLKTNLEQAQKKVTRDVQQTVKAAKETLGYVKEIICEECSKVQRTAKVVVRQTASTCSTFSENLTAGVQCIKETTESTSETKEQNLKDKCVMINEWNRGVWRKRAKIEAQTKGSPMQAYEPKIPKRAEVATEGYRNSFGVPIKLGPERLAMMNSRALLDDVELTPIMEWSEEISLSRQRGEEREYLGTTNNVAISLNSFEPRDTYDSPDEGEQENRIRKEFWNRQHMGALSHSTPVENEVVIKQQKISKRTSTDDTLDRLMSVWKTNMKGFHLNE